jgi:hypothetical protein
MNEYGSNGGIIVTGENRSTWRKTYTTASTTNLTHPGLGLNLGLCGERLVTNHLKHGKPFKILWHVNLRFQWSHYSCS